LAVAFVSVAKEPATFDLSLKDAAGKAVHLKDSRGKIVVLNFWATWCGPCAQEMPMLVDAEKEYGKRGVVFVGASMDDSSTKAQVPAFVANHNIPFPIWYGASAADMDKLKMGEIVPATAFLDEEGHIIARIFGQARKEEIKERLDWLTGNRAGPGPDPLVKHLGK
jgi:thiol-disulfide isomerase/thioredoxin